MKLLYSNILPLKTNKGKTLFSDSFLEDIKSSDEVNIAVGYVSKNALIELSSLVKINNIKKIILTIGMYYLEGMPEGTYNTAVNIQKEWKKNGIGEIRIVRPFKYHGKLYVFYKNGRPFKGYVGSHNLGAIKTEASNIRQYEISGCTEESKEVQEMSEFINDLNQEVCSVPIDTIDNMLLIREVNQALLDQEHVKRVTKEEVIAYQAKMTDLSFEIPLKVPANKEDPKMRGSNLNVCYAKGRKRTWWETEIVVGKDIRMQRGYPEYQKPFMAITDDGWKFRVWTCGDNNKNLYSKDDLKIMGRWLKGKLVASGLIEPVNKVEADIDGKGIITEEILKRYGRQTITLTKTQLKTTGEDGALMDTWMLFFLPESIKRKADKK